MEKRKLKDIINKDKLFYKSNNSFIKRLYNFFVSHNDYYMYKMIIYSRLYSFYKANSNNFIKKFYYGKKFFKYSRLVNCEIFCENIGENLKIFHGNVIINKNAIIGNNVKFHGNNCIGNNGLNEFAPIIGNDVDIGIGSVIIGKVVIADGIKIGANSIVTKSFNEKNITIAGNPAKKIK